MRSPFILHVFAVHLDGIAGAIDIESLEVARPRAGVSNTQMYPYLQLWAKGEIKRNHRRVS